jgi:hypothetical protein
MCAALSQAGNLAGSGGTAADTFVAPWPASHPSYREQEWTVRSGDRRRVAFEFVALVVGVFIAVAAESWWSDRQARAYERTVRHDMVEEFEANRRVLDVDLSVNDSIIAGLRVLAAMSIEELSALTPVEAQGYFGSMASLGSAGFDPSMGSAQALVRGGDLGLISDSDLRRELAAWSSLLDEKERFTKQHTEFTLLQMVPRLSAMESDAAWSLEERVEARSLLVINLNTLELVRRNQLALRQVAENVLSLLP